MNITIYTKSNCPNCVTAKQLLNQNFGREYSEVDVESDPERLRQLLAHYPEARQMPQIFVNGVRIGGLAGLQAYLPDIVAGRVA